MEGGLQKLSQTCVNELKALALFTHNIMCTYRECVSFAYDNKIQNWK